MIKFFRRIRQKLLSENKFSKYLIYAIGEIILVVIGILIALQINNWNESRKERKVEAKVLSEICDNLKRDKENLKIKIEETYGFKLSNEKVLEHLQKRTPLTSSLKTHYSRLHALGSFKAITAGYENLKSKGVDIIQNDILRSSITELYDYQYFHFIKDIANALGNFETSKFEYFSNHIYIEGGMSTKGNPYDLERLQKDEKFKGYLKSTIVSLDFINLRRKEGLEQIEKIIQSIENELEQ